MMNKFEFFTKMINASTTITSYRTVLNSKIIEVGSVLRCTKTVRLRQNISGSISFDRYKDEKIILIEAEHRPELNFSMYTFIGMDGRIGFNGFNYCEPICFVKL